MIYLAQAFDWLGQAVTPGWQTSLLLISNLNSLTPMRQDRISPYNINQITDENKEKDQFGANWLIQF